MGRLIPAGTGMRYYRNVEVEYDNTIDKKQERDYEELPIITGGMDLPDSSLDIPLVESDLDGFSIEDSLGATLSEEVFESADDIADDDDL